jgi:hypothetical protein
VGEQMKNTIEEYMAHLPDDLDDFLRIVLWQLFQPSHLMNAQGFLGTHSIDEDIAV